LASANGSEVGRDDEIEKDTEEWADGEEVFNVKKSTLLTMLTWSILCSGHLQILHGG
jgi:hypothetical protein